jgi:hypothetical protein
MTDYQRLFLDAITNVLNAYSEGQIEILSEADLQSHLFSECCKLMKERNFPHPLKLFAEKGVINKRKKVDLVLGDDKILIELKVEPDYPGVSKPVVFSTKRESGGYGSVEEDLEKIKEYAKRGKHAHFFMIDENGHHTRKIPGEWKTIQVKGKRSYYLHKYLAPKSLKQQTE